jgi:phosphoribosylformylglycinamidine cyclo-ligase
MNYKEAGVDIEKADGLIDKIKQYSDQIGPYGGQFNGDFVASCDGVGTKVMLAKRAKELYGRPLQSLGQDLVAMVVNDLLCQHAIPLVFMDYYATSKLNESDYLEVLEGIHSACQEVGCKLIGGETAEMPGMFAYDIFDVAGFGVGQVNKSIFDDYEPEAGDVVIGLPSSGVHSNGFSLVRKYQDQYDEEFVNKLLEPTVLYRKRVEEINSYGVIIKALAHITGGGFDNIDRILPSNLKLEWYRSEGFYYHHDLFEKIQGLSGMSYLEMRKTFNCGIGMMLVVPESKIDNIQNDYVYLGKLEEK